ncbi:MAG: S53 family peptidase [Candidatus Dormiibacterota bacterium]
MRTSLRSRAFRLIVTGGIAALGGAAAVAVPASGVAPAVAAMRLIPASAGHVLGGSFATPPTTADCLAHYGFKCYQPFQLQKAYDLAPLFGQGITGQGRTIVIVDAFGSPTIQSDLATFDTAFGLPAPPSFTVIQPVGSIPPCTADPFGVADCEGWGVETSLDVEWSHVMAPGANILLVETPSSETEGVQGFPDIVAAENYVINHHLGDVISQSFGATERTFPSAQSLLALRSSFINAAFNRVTVLAGSGDEGATNFESDLATLYPYPVNSWPSSDPLVTSLGGTQLNLDANGNRITPDVVWNDGYGASGGGLSSVFSRPFFQIGVRGVVGNQRGTPDISMSAAVEGAVDFYDSSPPYSAGNGWHIVGGTSEATPEFAGIVALADQAAGHRLGDINPGLYLLGALSKYVPWTGIVPVTSGNNSFAGVTGFNAGPGYNLATGWGTIDAAKFVRALGFF